MSRCRPRRLARARDRDGAGAELRWREPPELAQCFGSFMCPCIGFEFSETSAELDLVRSADGKEIERLALAPLFGLPPDNG